MPQQFFYQEYNILLLRIDKTIPDFVLENLNSNLARASHT